MSADRAPDRALATIVLAAGEGSRYGSPKQLAPIDGRPMLLKVLQALEGFGEQQVLVLGAHAERVRAGIGTGGWKVVLAEDWSSGQGASLRAGLRAAPEAQAALIVLGDLPWLRRLAVQRVLDAAAGCEQEAVRAFDSQTPGHPVLLRGRVLALARDAPDAGMGALLRSAAVAGVRCDGLGVARDVDVPADAADIPSDASDASDGTSAAPDAPSGATDR